MHESFDMMIVREGSLVFAGEFALLTEPVQNKALCHIEPPANLMTAWRRLLRILANSTDVPAALIMRIHPGELEIFVSSQNKENPYQQGKRVDLGKGYYSEAVIRSGKELLVIDALSDPGWDHNPDIELGMISYFGLPVIWPGGEAFGTICILENKPNKISQKKRKLVEPFRDVVQIGLEMVYENSLVEASNSRLSQVITQSPSPVVITNLNGNIEYVNPAFERIMGYAFDEVLGQNPSMWKSGNTPPEHYATLWKTIKSGRTWQGELHNKRKDGRLIWEKTTISPIRDATGEITHFFATEDNISGRKQDQAALRESQARFDSFIEYSPNKIHIKDTDGRYLMINPESEKLFGLSNEDALGKTAEQIFPNNIGDSFGAHDRAVIETGQPIQQEETFHMGDVERTYLTTKFPIRDASGSIVAVGSAGTDISRRRRAEASLRDAHDEMERRVFERTRQLTEEIQERREIEAELNERTKHLQLLNTLLTIANEADDINVAMTTCLEKVCEYMAWQIGHVYTASPSNPEKLIPSDIWCLKGPKKYTAFRNITMNTVFKKGVGLPGRILANGEPEWIEDVTKDGNFPRAKQKNRLGIRTGFGLPILIGKKVVAVMEFFSTSLLPPDRLLMNSLKQVGTQYGRLYERAESEKILHAARKKSESANQAKSAFLSAMSHELRTPLNAILGFSQLLDDDPRKPLSVDQKCFVDHIFSGGQHLLELINDVLDFAKIEAGKVDLVIENLSAKAVLDECLSIIDVIASERAIKIIIGDRFQTAAKVRADHTRFRQSLLNLLSNAVKYNCENGRITIDCHETLSRMLHISVTDTGDGIAEESLNELFEPFRRLKAEYTDIEGTGIGLTITKQLVERMGGRIGVDTEIGKGSTFWIELPLAEGKIIDEATTRRKFDDDDRKLSLSFSGTVLYIEDNPASLKLVESIIGRIEGLSILSAQNAKSGIELAKSDAPDLIIVDINLPDMDGFSVLKELQRLKIANDTPIIALSANAMPEFIEKGIKAGFRNYLTKPINIETLVDLIEDVLRTP